MSASIEGGCLCRAVRFRATGAPVATSLCHCTTCRLATGAPSVGWVVFRAGDFQFTGAVPRGFESSAGVLRTFCATCGTSLTYQSASRPDVIDVTTASLDRPEDFAPAKEIWTGHGIGWETLNGAIPHYSRSSVGAAPEPT